MQSRRKIVAASCRLCTRLLPILGSLVAYFEVLSSALWCCSHAGSVSFPAWERSQSRLLATPNPKSSDCKLTFAAFLTRFRLKQASRKPISLVTISRLQRQENLFFCHFLLHLMVILKDNINAYFFVVSLDSDKYLTLKDENMFTFSSLSRNFSLTLHRQSLEVRSFSSSDCHPSRYTYLTI